MEKHKYDSRVRHFIRTINSLNLPHSKKATEILLEEMSAEKGFSRHDGSDYFVHPIAIAQTAIDFRIISDLIREGQVSKADEILAVCLLHDVMEDVDFVDFEFIKNQYNENIAISVDNVSKRKGESMEDYLERVSSNMTSSIVKILDRLNNVSTLSESSDSHRLRQLKETQKYYLPLCEVYRNNYWQFSHVFHQVKTIMEAILREIEREIKTKGDSYSKQVRDAKMTSLAAQGIALADNTHDNYTIDSQKRVLKEEFIKNVLADELKEAYESKLIVFSLLSNGYWSFQPNICPHCKESKLETKNEAYLEGAGVCEFDYFCPSCDKIISSFAYGQSDLSEYFK